MLAVGFKNNQEDQIIVSNSISIAITLFISAAATSIIKILCSKKIRIDDFKQWIEGTSMEQKLQEDYVDVEPVQRPKT